jgi:hypothetical protein
VPSPHEDKLTVIQKMMSSNTIDEENNKDESSFVGGGNHPEDHPATDVDSPTIDKQNDSTEFIATSTSREYRCRCFGMWDYDEPEALGYAVLVMGKHHEYISSWIASPPPPFGRNSRVLKRSCAFPLSHSLSNTTQRVARRL